ncbi:hypothetical protein BX600DRAFT_160239 [Xylariales sp. PMI_506]|nr:hypothetical protein BX600DRAFT_160239 [Xylariales sp. PMI_506]
MPRKKNPKGKRQGQINGSRGQSPAGRSRRGLLDKINRPSLNSTSPSPFFKPFAQAHTLADEAKFTGHRRRDLFEADSKFRNRPIAFVSAGCINPMKELEAMQKDQQPLVVQDPAENPAEDPAATGLEAQYPTIGVDISSAQTKDIFQSTEKQPRSDPPHLAAFTIDTSGDRSLRPVKEQPVKFAVDVESGNETDSSEEVILFKGRDSRRHTAAQPPRVGSQTRQSTSRLVKHGQKGNQSKEAENSFDMQIIETKTPVSCALQVVSSEQETLTRGKSHEQDDSRFAALLDVTQSDEDAAIIADYISNMNGDNQIDDSEADTHPDLGSHAFHMPRDLGGTDSDAVPHEVTLDESDEFSSEEDNNTGVESSEALKRIIELKDERIARILAKQEELGLGSDDILLYDDADNEDGEDDWQIAPKVPPRRKKKKKGSSQTARLIQKKGQYPSASAMADAFDDLSLMDWHRAALSRYNQATAQFSPAFDSDLEEAMDMSVKKDRPKMAERERDALHSLQAAMETARQNDRLKKAEKKKEREARRAQGLLGKNINLNDLRVKYPLGMAQDDLVSEIERFIVDEDEELILPPFDQEARKSLHLLAHNLKIKSSSAGSGTNRHSVLYRTGRTRYDEGIFEAFTSRYLKRHYYARADADSAAARQQAQAVSSKRKRNATTYREGEVVGQHAAELTSDNKGRLLLEKMGWSKGMALGASENKGIIVPIAQVMKNTKAGLGGV